jgi:D-cysteine desulfhydrase
MENERFQGEKMTPSTNFARTMARKPLGFLPTPLIRLNNLERYLGGPRILMKRDDQTGLGFGGNKTRKLEYLLGDALQQGADCLITAGAAQSNHCRQTAAAAAACGLECHLALGGAPPKSFQGNLLLDMLFGARIHWSGELRKGENIPAIAENLRAENKTPYIIPYGGSNAIGAMGFVAAMYELENQLEEMDEHIDHIVFASSSGGTHSGMMVGRELAGAAYTLIGINIDKDEINGMSLDDQIIHLAENTAGLIDIDFTPKKKDLKKDLDLNAEYLGEGYGVVGSLEREAISLTARYEGILLDPVYTGRAMGGMLDMIRSSRFSKDETVLFWHTGGSPALFAYGDLLLRHEQAEPKMDEKMDI